MNYLHNNILIIISNIGPVTAAGVIVIIIILRKPGKLPF